MYQPSFWHRTVCIFPNFNGPKFPFVWMLDFNMGALIAIAIYADAGRSNDGPFIWTRTRFELRIGRKVNSFQVLIPRKMTDGVALARPNACAQFVADHVRFWRFVARNDMRKGACPLATAFARAKQSSIFPIGLVGKWYSA